MFRSSLFTRPFGLAMPSLKISALSPLIHSTSPFFNMQFFNGQFFNAKLTLCLNMIYRICKLCKIITCARSLCDLCVVTIQRRLCGLCVKRIQQRRKFQWAVFNLQLTLQLGDELAKLTLQ